MDKHADLRLPGRWALLLAVVLLLGLCPHASADQWAELAWDDGDLGAWGTPFVAGRSGQMLAVGFEAPEWAQFLIGAKFYIHNDYIDDPSSPGQPTAHPFLVRVWRPSSGLHEPPGEPAIDGISTSVCSQFPYYVPEDEWLEVQLEVPLPLEANRDDSVFFVGMEWQHRLSPLIGTDIGPTPDLTS